MKQAYNKYIGARYVPIIYGEWDNGVPYEPLTIVTYQGASYTSKKYVPVGIDISNNGYWVLTGNYNAQVEAYRQDVINYKNETNQKITDIQTQFNNKLKDFVEINIKDYGAKGDGVTDDTQAFMDAYADLQEGQTLYFPSGTYMINTATEMLAVTKNNIIFKGAGRKKSIINAVASKAWGLLLQGNNIDIVDLGFIKIMPSATVPTAGLQPPLYFHNGLGTCFNNNIINCYIEGGASNIRCDANKPKDCKVINTYMVSNTTGTDGTCFAGRSGDGILIYGCYCEGGTGASALNYYGCSNSTLMNNVVRNNKFAGCESEDTQGKNIIIGNHFINCRHGVMVDDTFDCIIADNVIETNVIISANDCGIYMSSTSLADGSVWNEGNIIANNIIKGYHVGIQLICTGVGENNPVAKITDILIESNKIKGCRKGIIVGSVETITKISNIIIQSNKIEYNNSVHDTAENGIYVGGMVDKIYIQDNQVLKYVKNIYVYNNALEVYLLRNVCKQSTNLDIDVATSNNKSVLIGNITDKKISFAEITVFTQNTIMIDNYSKDGFSINNLSTQFAFTPTTRMLKNVNAGIIKKGQIVKFDISYVWATNCNIATTKNDPFTIGVAQNDINPNEYGNIIVKGLCEVLTDTTTTAIAKGNFLTNQNGLGIKADTGDVNLMVAMDAVPINSENQLVKAVIFK